MRGNRLGVGLLWAGLAGLGAASAASAAPAPCAEITAACESAGFTPGDARGGNGLKLDCVDPIMQGTPQPRRARLPLPAVDPQVVAACKAGDPRFGAAKSAAAPAVAAPTVAAPSAPVVPAAPTVPTMVPPLPPGAKRPNIVFVLTDDLAWNLVQYMPHVLQMQKDGVTFANYFVTDSLCCPSRSSIFTGRYPHDTGVFTNGHDDGGYLVFRNRGNEQVTFAKALAAAGYRTAMLGKYLNGYEPRQHPPAPGWTSWAVAGAAYREFKYALNEDGKVVRFGDSPGDYLTDVLSGIATRFIKQAAGAPFLIEIATFAPHAPYIPAPRDADALPGLAAPRTPAFDVAPDTSMPDWVRKLPALTGADKAAIDKAYRMRAQSVLAVDAMIGQLQAAVAASGQAQNTYFVFSSDNGLHMGEHRMMPGKMTRLRHGHPRAAHRHRAGDPGGAPGGGGHGERRSLPDLRRAGIRRGARHRGRPQPGAAAARRERGGMALGGADRASWPTSRSARSRRARRPQRQSRGLRGDPRADVGLCGIQRRSQGISRSRRRSL